ncbi:DUF3631 domain-containing protein [Amorphoplanes digitatis]|uniref:DUF3631 domain-containing protein n=1 Tax=Actinoplanes digitatis TaxID=1868 RepID=A0A7W7HV66_9ACTN|nr:DUF3631 domain-containing protein [Actinoplanes digitatis]MBB4761394.1 hypothetical protein [Actinoplanes digitatis]GID94560.1 hypothetical protein Adi01nite_39720 [Actinoplanes digitatis]
MTDPSPPPEGAAILDRLHAALTRYVILPSAEAVDAAVLWIAATHAQPAWTYAARLVIKAPEKRCGKSRLLDVVDGTCYRPLMTVNASTPAIYRSIGTDDPPTILLDEADTIFGGKQAEANEDLRGLLNAGHQRGRPTIRWNQQKQQVEQIQTFAMAALAGIGSMPDTIEDRAVVIKMRRRTAAERVAPFRQRRDGPALRQLAADLNAWLRGNMIELEAAIPAMPLEDRAADTWEPLIAVADLAGGNWPERARSAALALNAAREGDVEYSDRLRLLIDCRTVFGDLDAIPSTVLLDRLKNLPEAPWAEFNGTGLTAMKLGVLLREYEIASENIRFPPPVGRIKGFHRACFTDAWERYCPAVDPVEVTGPDKPYQPYQADVSAAHPRYGLLRAVRPEPYQEEAGTA